MGLGLNLENIKEIVNSGKENWETLLIKELATCKSALPLMNAILDEERSVNHQLITDLNAMLCQAHVILEEPKLNDDGFMQKRLNELYKSGRIGHCFKMEL